MSRYRLKDFHKGQRVLSQMNESCHIWMCHGAHEGVMVHVNESCHIRRTQYHAFQVMTTLWHIWMNLGRYECVMANIWMCHGTYEWVLSQMNESWHIWMSRGTYERHTRAIPHMTTYRLSRRSTNHARYGWVMPHMKESWYTWMNHVTYDGVISHMHEQCHVCMTLMGGFIHVKFLTIARGTSKYEWVMSQMTVVCHKWMRNVTYKWVMAHMHDADGKFHSCQLSDFRAGLPVHQTCAETMNAQNGFQHFDDISGAVLAVLQVCCSVLQCVAVCCSVLQCVAVCCSVLQCFAVSCSVLQCVAFCCSVSWCVWW